MKPLRLFLSAGLFAGSLSFASSSYTWDNVRFEGGGFVCAVIPSRTQPDLIYARTDVGGVYRWNTTDGKWIPLTDWISQNDVGLYGAEALALDPNDPKRLYVLAGTRYFSNGKTAILRSFDYGATFDTVVVTSHFKAHGNGMGRQTGEKLAVDPNNSSILFCGSRLAGLWKSSDTGRTWAQASKLGAASDTGSSNLDNINGVSFVLFDSASGLTTDGGTKTLYLGVSSMSSSANLFVSQDGGSTFTPISGGPALMPMRATLDHGNLYLTYSNGPGPYSITNGAIYKYAIASGTWTNITPKDTATGSYFGSGGNSYSHGFGGLDVDPADPNHLVASSLNYYGNQWRWSNGNDAWGDKIFISTDGGASWSYSVNTTNTGTNSTISANGNAWIPGNAVHWAGCVRFDNTDNKKVWVTSGNGIFRTDDITASTPVWAFQSRGLEETVPLDIVSIPGGPLVSAIGDYDGAVYSNVTKSFPRHTPTVGSTNSLGYAPLTGDLLRTGVVTVYGTYSSTDYNKMFWSRDTGKSWKETDSSKVSGPKVLVALSADGRVFLHRPENGSTTYYSTDSGASWSSVKGLSSNSGNIVPDPVNPAKLYTMTDNAQGIICASSDTGKSFAKVGSLVDNGKGLYAMSSQVLRAAPGREGDLWAPLDQAASWVAGGYSQNGLAHSTDGGVTWTRISGLSTCISIGLGKAAPGASYFALYIWGAPTASSPIGIYRSDDMGTTWVRANDDAHQFGGPGNGNFVTGDFNIYGRVYMSTVGRGLVYGEPTGTSAGINHSAINAVSAQLSASSSHIWVHASDASALQLELRDATGRLVLAVPTKDGASVSLSGLGRGMLFARLSSQGKTLATRTIARP